MVNGDSSAERCCAGDGCAYQIHRRVVHTPNTIENIDVVVSDDPSLYFHFVLLFSCCCYWRCWHPCSCLFFHRSATPLLTTLRCPQCALHHCRRAVIAHARAVTFKEREKESPKGEGEEKSPYSRGLCVFCEGYIVSICTSYVFIRFLNTGCCE
jgi:hypothetical protein